MTARIRYTDIMQIIRTLSLAAFLLLPFSANAAAIYLDPVAGEYGPGDTFIVSIRIDNEQECLNAAHVSLSYPVGRLRATDFGRGDSIFSLWAEEPKLDTATGKVTFSGGVPGGYCGRVQGDPSESNLLGKVIFTVLRSDAADATLSLDPTSAVYLNDGLGTRAELTLRGATITIAPEAQTTEDAWLKEVRDDLVPPEPFAIDVESVESLFGGRYFAAFSTVDKQSGVDHYEIFERGGWVTVTSPHKLANQSLRGGVQIKAIDKAGNERLGDYVPSDTPPPAAPRYDLLSAIVLLVLLVLTWTAKRALDRRRALDEAVQ